MSDKLNEYLSVAPVGPNTFSSRNDEFSTMQKKNIAQSRLFMARQAQEDRLNKGENILPFPLNTVGDHIANAATELIEAKADMLRAYSSGLLKKSEKEVLKRSRVRIDRIKEMLEEIVQDISTMKV